MDNIPLHRRWMYNRTYPTRGGLKPEFIDGVDTFIKHAKGLEAFRTEGVIRCPCIKCLREWDFLSPAMVTRHLYSNGFKPNYWYWTDHGEVAPKEETTSYFGNAASSKSHELFSQAAGRPNKKRKAYGMHCLKSKCLHTSTSTSSQNCSTSSTALPELDELRRQQQQQKLLEEHAALRQQMLEEQAELRRQQEQAEEHRQQEQAVEHRQQGQAELRRQQEQILSDIIEMASMFQQQLSSKPDVQCRLDD